jgi:hypothetical protein
MSPVSVSIFSPDLLRDEVALVTGASRGIGRAIADRLGQAGATVVGTATTEAGASAISARLAEAGVRGRGAVLDVRDAAASEISWKATRSTKVAWSRLKDAIRKGPLVDGELNLWHYHYSEISRKFPKPFWG